LFFINQLNTFSILVTNWIGGNSLNENMMLKSRDELEAKMAAVFGDQIKELSTEMKQILIDDLVTAFESRLNVLNRPRVNRELRH
jgi:hypothetical protein